MKWSYISKCPSCGGKAYLTEITKNNLGHRGEIYGRIVCMNNSNSTKSGTRCYMKTICGPIDQVLRSWNATEG